MKHWNQCQARQIPRFVRGGVAILHDAPTLEFIGNWGSNHESGAYFAFADGSVQILRFGTPADVVHALLTYNGGEIVELEQ